MSEGTVFNSKDAGYKSPYGAVAAGTAVSFTLRPQRAEGFSQAQLYARFESRGDETVCIAMPWQDTDLGQDAFHATLETGDYVGLVWYRFVLQGLDGRKRELGEYQLTVYDAAQAAPAWFGAGVCYQIFPDRFCRSRIPAADGLVGGRSVHTNWDDQPEYRPNERGEVRNRDFFGGDLQGIIHKLDYLAGLGVDTLYLNPIFEAAENHRYGTADYTKIDPMLGTNQDFTDLCNQAHQRGMRVILDGVFNHTGFVSRYFNGDGSYDQPGAYQSQQSPYYPWFRFVDWPRGYESWWGIYSLPAVNPACEDYRSFIFAGAGAVVRRWLEAGADGWRLDVADELPDEFISGLHRAVRETKADGIVLGEVWEDGSNKVAYSVRRKHILGGHCDGLMNYPLRNAILSFFLRGDGGGFVREMEAIRENYPPFAFYSAMNILGTHDTPRILTLLGTGDDAREQPKHWRAEFRLSPAQYALGKERLKAAAVLLFTFPGAPTVYYGDEAGVEGFEDPFNRKTYPWGREDHELVDWFAALGRLRRNHPALQRGEITYLAGEGPLLAYLRTVDEERVLCVFHAGDEPLLWTPEGVALDTPLLGEDIRVETEQGWGLLLPPRSGRVYLLRDKGD